MSRSMGVPTRFSWFAATSLAACLAATASAAQPTPVASAPPSPPSPSVAQAPAQSQIAFHIPPQPLSSALTAFGKQSGYQVSVDHRTLAGLATRGVSGRMTPEQALQQLLSGSGVTWRFTEGNSVVLTKAGKGSEGALTLDPITVEGKGETAWGPVDGYVATRSATGTKTDTPLIETPQSITVITRQQMEDQNVQSVGEALRYSPGVRTEAEGSSSLFDVFSVRGFTQANADIYRDGMRQQLWNGDGRAEPYAFERIEILRGPAAVLYGQGSPGGLVNLVTKLPTATSFREVMLEGGSFERKQGAVDLGGPIDDAGTWSYRLTGLVRDSDTQIDYVPDDRWFVAPAVTWRPNAKTSLTLLGEFKQDRTIYVRYLPASGTVFSNPNGTVPTNRFLNEPDDFYDTDNYSGGYMFRHNLNSDWTARQNFRFGHNAVEHRSVQAIALQGDLRTMDRFAFAAESTTDVLVLDNQLEAKVDTGPLNHTALAGLDFRRQSYDEVARFGTASAIDLFDPVYGQGFSLPASPSNDVSQTLDQLGIYFQDQIKLNKWALLLGGRQDWARSVTDDNLANTQTKQRDDAFTFRSGLVYLFDTGIAPYAGFAQTFQPVSGTDRLGNAFEPRTGDQFEVGVKFQPKGQETFVTLSAYQIKQQNLLTPDPVNPAFSTQIGEVTSRGIELGGLLSLGFGLDVIASYSYNHAEVTESNDIDMGKRPTQVPEHLASLWGDYKVEGGILQGLSFGTGVRYVGSTAGDFANTFDVPAFTVVDAALRYEWRNLRLAINVSNLFDKEYVAGCFSLNGCAYGGRRTVLGTLRYRW